MSEYDILEQHDPMPLMDVLNKVREGCEMHMNQLDNDGYCAESDDYVVALAFFEDYIEKIKAEEEEATMREAEWGHK
jgi:energy-converting hydrogenase A subunit M